MVSPSEHFGLPIIGVVATPEIAGLPARTYDVIRVVELLDPAGRSFMVNVWFNSTARVPLHVVEQFGAVYTPHAEGGQ